MFVLDLVAATDSRRSRAADVEADNDQTDHDGDTVSGSPCSAAVARCDSAHADCGA